MSVSANETTASESSALSCVESPGLERKSKWSGEMSGGRPSGIYLRYYLPVRQGMADNNFWGYGGSALVKDSFKPV